MINSNFLMLEQFLFSFVILFNFSTPSMIIFIGIVTFNITVTLAPPLPVDLLRIREKIGAESYAKGSPSNFPGKQGPDPYPV